MLRESLGISLVLRGYINNLLFGGDGKKFKWFGENNIQVLFFLCQW